MGQKLKIILSDLHIGAGYAGGRNQLEDFLADQELVDFLHSIQHECDRDLLEVELIINGDFFEFLQVPAVENFDPAESYPPEAYLDSSEEASVQRLNIIAQGHPQVFNALSDFMYVEHPQRRITIIKGNHDVNLFWPRVKSRLREILGASGTRASLLLFADEFVSRERIYVEHGHQRAEKINAYRDFFNPRSHDDPDQLYYPPGSRFVIDCLTQKEQRHWFVDHVKPVTALIWTALSWDFDEAAQLLTHYAGCLEVEENGAQTVELDHFLHDLQDDAKRHALSQQYAIDQSFQQQFHRQIQQLLTVESVNSQRPPSPPPLGNDPLEIGQSNGQQQHHLLRHAATEIAQSEGAKIIVFGHTHNPVQETLENGSVYINAGCWIEDFSQAAPEIWQALFNGTRLPQKETAPLSYVRIDYDDDIPAGTLKFLNQPVSDSRSDGLKMPNWLARLLPWGSN